MLGPEFGSCGLKIARAEEHAETINNEVREWSATDPYGLIQKRDSQGSRHSFHIEVRNEPPLQRWSLIAGDCVHNLRSALDHFLYAIVLRKPAGILPGYERSIQFPIADCPSRMPTEKWYGLLSGKVRTAIDGVQPYNRPHADFRPLLGVVRDLNNSDKHRLLNVHIPRLQRAEFPGITVPDGHTVRNFFFSKVGLVDGAEVASFTVDPPCIDVKYQGGGMAITVVLRHVPGPTGIEFTTPRILLPLLCKEVRDVIEIMNSTI
jgi:hypothetical protein